MKIEQFYKQYASTPLNLRDVPLSIIDNPITLNQIYKEVQVHNEAVRTEERAIKNKIELAVEIWSGLDML